MAFELHGLPSEGAPRITLDSLASDLRVCFLRTEGFHLELEADPFDSARRNLLLTWGLWWMKVFIETGPVVAAASAEIAASAGEGSRGRHLAIDRRIRFLFADDQDRRYANHAIFMMDFLGALPGIALFDP